MSRPFAKILVANRGAAASRILRAVRELGASPVAVYSEADRNAYYLALADQTFALGPASARESYLNMEALLGAIRASGADAVHPGYGFLSENADFARAVTEAGVTFIGPAADHIAALGYKTAARERMAELGVPMWPSSGIVTDEGTALREAERVGYPVLMKPAGGGGGVGITPAESPADLKAAFGRANARAGRNFASAGLYLERLIRRPRHVEFQMLADQHGECRCLFDRDCSVQRRHQKVIEEAPAPKLPAAARERMATQATAALRAMGYDNIGTVETLYSEADGFGFLEVNTRLQVEHAVTEEITGVDLVKSQIRAAAGERLADILPAEIGVNGWAIEVRLYAEDPRTFRPSPGTLEIFRLACGSGIRIETGYSEGDAVTPYYDPMIAKVIAHGSDREEARRRLLSSLERSTIAGLASNLEFLCAALRDPTFVEAEVHTGLAETIARSLPPAG